MLAWLCYLLVAAVWALDLLTPQLFIAAILLNAPIALSSIAFDRRLTITLVLLAEVANFVSGIVNGAQAHHHTDPIAIGDRVLLAASFLLVAAMALKTQELGQRAGVVRAREEQAQRERRLRFASERVHATLNADLVVNTICAQALRLTDARCGIYLVGSEFAADALRVTQDADGRPYAQHADLSANVRSLLAGLTGSALFERSGPNLVAGLALEDLGHAFALGAAVDLQGEALHVLLLRDGAGWSVEDGRMLMRFLETGAGALAQARLFARNLEQTGRIAEQNHRLLERSSVIRDLVYALAHDLRTPLAAADLTMRQAQAGAYGEIPARYADVLRNSVESNVAMQRNVETLLTVARYESDDWPTLREIADASEIAASARRELEPAAHAKGVVLSSDGPAGLRLNVDPSEIRRACVNLAANAIAATPAGGRVRIGVKPDGEAVRFSVEDDGYGVEPELRDALFKRFGTVRRGHGSGSGLGLYVVRLIVERHGGSVRYEPRTPRGSRFLIRLPRAA